MDDAKNDFDGKTINQTGFAYLNLIQQDRWESFTPVFGSITLVGTPVYTGRYRRVGRQCQFQVRIVPGTTIATSAGTDYMNLPIAAQGVSGFGYMVNATTHITVNEGHIDTTLSQFWLPTQGASGNTFELYGEYEV